MIIFEYKWHLFHCIISFFILSALLNFSATISCFLGLFLGCIFPDIDTSKSTINNLLIVTKPISFFINHRGFTHSFIGLFIFCYLSCLIDIIFNFNGFSIGFIIGYASHLLVDFTTPIGIELLWPLPFFIKLPLISYNEKISKIFWLLLFIMIVFKYLIF